MPQTTATPPDHLLRGYRRFRAERFAGEEARFRELAGGQSPRTMIVGCADSRVDPATIFSAAPGELFVVRNVAAIVPPCDTHDPEAGSFHGTSAALEFAVAVLGVEEIVVMGHGQCGGVAVALAAEHGPQGRFIGPWVNLLSPALDRLRTEDSGYDAAARQRALEHLSIRQSLEYLGSFPFVASAVAEGKLALHGAWFSIAEGELHWFDSEVEEFVTVRETD